MKIQKYWPLDYCPECEIYENPAWNLPGYRRRPVLREDHLRPNSKKVRAKLTR